MIRKLSDFKGEDAVDVWAEILVPVGKIIGNSDLNKKRNNDFEFISCLMKDNKSEVLKMLSILSDDENYIENVNGVTIMQDVMELLKDADMRDFFGLRVQGKKTAASA